MDYINDEMTLGLAFVKAVASSVFYSPFANGLFLAGARVLRYGFKVRIAFASCSWGSQVLCLIVFHDHDCSCYAVKFKRPTRSYWMCLIGYVGVMREGSPTPFSGTFELMPDHV